MWLLVVLWANGILNASFMYQTHEGCLTAARAIEASYPDEAKASCVQLREGTGT